MMKATSVLLVVLLVTLASSVKIPSSSSHTISFDRKIKPSTAHKEPVVVSHSPISIDQIKPLLGWKPSGAKALLEEVDYVADEIPASFDARQQWSNCSSIGSIQNQAECGSCWAFGAVEAITDRFCIHKGVDTQLSFQDLVTCDQSDDGCNGGDAATAWMFAKRQGLVSAECSPYTIPTCPPAQQPCLNFVDTPACVTKCSNSSIEYKEDKRKIETVYSVSSKPAAIQTEIMTNGPVEACFNVYADFVDYKSGVYKHSSGSLLGGHCVKILGWGVDNSEPYWIVANSWTTSWGNQGYFWIARGSDESGIESDVVAGSV
eukprot:TRINITY_DN106_c0_g1_i1.p1 TRINITY_DN106_c0_g1~~TRINITY_DN106_c0_g1_i1.p1  ORF type:complete len:318 (+),score=97.72 TRINITY_DN106_c0_g1_i1:177-1130(+)